MVRTARAAADVGDHQGWGRKLSQHDLRGALELEHAARLGEAITLLAPGVVLVQGRVDGAVHESLIPLTAQYLPPCQSACRPPATTRQDAGGLAGFDP
jgi:hypothetical protein